MNCLELHANNVYNIVLTVSSVADNTWNRQHCHSKCPGFFFVCERAVEKKLKELMFILRVNSISFYGCSD